MKLFLPKISLMTLLFGLFLIVFSSVVLAYEDYSGCSECHGGFRSGTYTSLATGDSWGTDLMSGHESFVGDECDACHKSGGRGEVFLNFSQENVLSKSCVGCHGRDEDVTDNCLGFGGMAVECGSGAGLRKHHETEVGSGTCNGCHSNDETPIGENTNPYYYGLGGVVMQNACDSDGTESQVGTTGLDNDGDGLRDGGDSDCQSNSPPTQPGALSASAITTSSATVSWGASTDSDGDTITYLVEYRRNGDPSWSSAGSTTTTSRPLSGLDADQFYDVQVTPNDGTVDGTTRTMASLFKTDADIVNTPPTQPGTLSASLITTSSATVSWGASTDNEGDTITYLVEYRRSGDLPWTSAGSTTATSQLLTGLNSSQSYDVRVTPNDGSVDGTSRMALNLFTTDTSNTPPTQPGALSASAITTTSATVSWGASTDNEGDTITYLVEYRRNGDVPWTSAGSTPATSQPLSGLDASQSYDVRVTPNDGSVDGPSRTTMNLFVTDDPNVPPTQPGTLSASAIGVNSATVSWGASTDDDGDSITYKVEYRRGGTTTWNSAGSTAAISMALSGLDSDQAYDVRVTPNDGTEDGLDRTALNLFQTEVNPDDIFKDSFEGN